MWTNASEEYRSLIGSEDWDSRYLRERGLIPNVLDLIGDCSGKAVLDAGTGTGWLFEQTQPKEAHACDLVQPKKLPANVVFRKDDVHDLSYANNKFDLINASLLLLYCYDLKKVLREFHRVAKTQGSLVISLMHPYFYRTGEILPNGQFLLTEDLAHERQFDFHIGEKVGPFTYFYRPLPIYLNSLIESGWRIENVRDWFIDMSEYEHLRKYGVKSKLQRSGKLPLFTFVKATRE